MREQPPAGWKMKERARLFTKARPSYVDAGLQQNMAVGKAGVYLIPQLTRYGHGFDMPYT